MAVVKIVDIKGEQWDFKDEAARIKIETIEQKVDKNFTYSTEEIDTGEKWINGKKIYRRVFTGDFGSIGGDFINLTSKISDVNETNIDTILSIWARGTFNQNMNQFSSAFKCESRNDNNYYLQMVGGDLQNVNIIMLKYTKTTD